MAGSARQYRDVDGILLLDKPQGMTSNRALQIAKRHFQARKAGHTGSLDPLATGLLPLCFGEATKVSQYLLESDKRYWAALRLGVSTNTYDAEGEVTATRPVAVDRPALERALVPFRGDIEQVPPSYSAIKQDGQPLYKLARAGVEVVLPPRPVTIYELKLAAFEGDRVELEILCSKGTYIRSLAHDLGEILGCGAHVTALRRLGMGGFEVSEAIALDALLAIHDPQAQAALLRPADAALSQFPAVQLSTNAAYYLCQGQVVSAGSGHPRGLVRLYGDEQRFLGLGEVQPDGLVAPRRLLRGA